MYRIITIIFLAIAVSPIMSQESSQAGIVERVEILGNVRTRKEILMRELKLRPGTDFSLKNIEEDKSRLLATGILNNVEAQIKQGSTPNKWVVVFVVHEKYHWFVEPRLHSNRLQGYSFGLTANHINFRGCAEKLTGTLLFGGIRHQSLTWENPWLVSSARGFASSTLSHEESDYLYSDSPIQFEQQRTAIRVALGIHPIPSFSLGLQAVYEQVHLSNSMVAIGKTRVNNLPAYGLFFQINSRNWKLYPTRGWYIHGDLRRVRSRFIRFDRLRLDLRRYQPFPLGDLLAIHAVAVLSRGRLPVYERVHMGGWRSLRGYEWGTFAGDNMLRGSLEYRFPLGFVPGPWNIVNAGVAGVAFYDIGQTWWRDKVPKFSDPHDCIGLGIHLLVQLIVFRIEYGYNGSGSGLLYVSTGVEF